MDSSLKPTSVVTIKTSEKYTFNKKVVDTKTIERIANFLGLTTTMTEEAIDMFERVSQTPLNTDTTRRRKAFAGPVPGGCVHIVCRLHGWQDVLHCVSKLVNTPPQSVACWAQHIARNLSFNMPRKSRASRGMTMSITMNPPITISKSAEELAVSIVDVWRNTLFARNDRSILHDSSVSLAFNVAQYLAWQAEEPMSRRTVTRAQFCKMYLIKSHFPSLQWNEVWADMQNVLCRLARQIPWVNNKVEPENVVMYIKDVCAHHKKLLASTSMKELMQGVGLDDRDLTVAPTQHNARECDSSGAIHVQDMVFSAPGTFDPYTILVINNPDPKQPATTVPTSSAYS